MPEREGFLRPRGQAHRLLLKPLGRAARKTTRNENDLNASNIEEVGLAVQRLVPKRWVNQPTKSKVQTKSDVSRFSDARY
jgi:hypothetical protein